MQFESFFDLVGKTPVVKYGRYKDAEIFLKLEGFNPTGSIKDRTAKYIIQDKLRRGELKSGKRLLDASSGSFACALSYFGMLMKYPVTVVANAKVTENNLKFLQINDTEVVLHGQITKDGYDYCTGTLLKESDMYCFADQLNNWESPKAHYETTAPEILKSVPDVTAVAASMGSGATLCGISQFFNEKKPDVKVIASIARPGEKIAGTYLEGVDYVSPFIQKLDSEDWIDTRIPVSFQEAIQHARELATRGFFVGPQTGGVFHAAIGAIDKLGISGRVVVVSGDSGWKNLAKLSS